MRTKRMSIKMMTLAFIAVASSAKAQNLIPLPPVADRPQPMMLPAEASKTGQIAVGMTADEVIAILKASYPNMRLQEKTDQIEHKGVKSAPFYRVMLFYLDPAPNQFEKLTIFFTSPLTGNRVYALMRELTLNNATQSDTDQLRARVQQVFARQSLTQQQQRQSSGVTTFLMGWDENGNFIMPSERRHRCLSEHQSSSHGMNPFHTYMKVHGTSDERRWRSTYSCAFFGATLVGSTLYTWAVDYKRGMDDYDVTLRYMDEYLAKNPQSNVAQPRL